MDKKKAWLDLIFEGPENQINIFFHGYTSISSQKKYDSLVYKILSAKPPGKVYLFGWRSGSIIIHKFTHLAKLLRFLRLFKINPVWLVADAIHHIAHFKYYKSKAEKNGRRLMQRVYHLSRKYPNHKINLIGHSLGARIIFYALAFSDWKKYNIQDVILLAAVVDRDSEHWEHLLQNVKGIVYNAYSRIDGTLIIAPTFELLAGAEKISFKSKKIVNREYPSFVHKSYWKKIDYLLPRLWKGYKKSKSY